MKLQAETFDILLKVDTSNISSVFYIDDPLPQCPRKFSSEEVYPQKFLMNALFCCSLCDVTGSIDADAEARLCG